MIDVLPAESFQNILLLQPFIAPVPTFLRPVAGIKFEISSLSGYIFFLFQFKHLLCSLSSIVNKILAHVIRKSFSFHFIQI